MGQILSQCAHMSNHHNVHFKTSYCVCQLYSIKLGGRKKFSPLVHLTNSDELMDFSIINCQIVESNNTSTNEY